MAIRLSIFSMVQAGRAARSWPGHGRAALITKQGQAPYAECTAVISHSLRLGEGETAGETGRQGDGPP